MSELIQSYFRRRKPSERLARFNLRSDLLDAADLMVSDRRTDPQIVRLQVSLTESERVLRMVDGRHARERGLLVLTDHRIFFRSRDSDGPVAFGVRLTDIDSVVGSTRKVVGTVSITAADGHFVVDGILGIQGEMMADAARGTEEGVVTQRRDPLQLLEELRSLRDRGDITAAEFEAHKAELWKDI